MGGRSAAVLREDVKVGIAGLHQEHVRPLGDVLLDLPHGFAEVGAVHLVAAAVAELRGGVGRLAERAVEGRSRTWRRS